ncbi:hypothetical protein [Pseudoduganella sp. HUAS MS19]
MNEAIFRPGSIASAGQCLRDAASRALDLLESNGPRDGGNTSDNLRIAIANYEEAMMRLSVTVKLPGEAPCVIAVAPGKANHQVPDRAALERAHRALRTSMPLDEMLKQPALAKTLAIVALQKPRKERDRFDWRKAQANDLD